MAVAVGGFFGRAASMILKKDKQRANENLKKVYGDELAQSDRDEIIREMFTNFGKNIADVLRFKRYYHKQISKLIEVEGIEHFDEVYNRGKGMIAVTGHIGNFELLAAYFANAGYKVAVIGRELYDKRLDKLLVDNRESMGEVNVDTKDSPKKIVKLLREGYALGVLIDIDSMRVRGEYIPAFGHSAYTPVGQSILGLKTGAGFVPSACVREGNRYKIIVKPEITIERTDDFERDVYNITKKCAEAIEEIIHSYKEQWIWLHRRWGTKPKEGERETKSYMADIGEGDDK